MFSTCNRSLCLAVALVSLCLNIVLFFSRLNVTGNSSSGSSASVSSGYCNGDFAEYQVTDQATCEEQCHHLVDDGTIPKTAEYFDAKTSSAVATWYDLTSPGADGGPVWSSSCTCGDPDDGAMYCWEIGTAGWVFMAIPIIFAFCCGVALCVGFVDDSNVDDKSATLCAGICLLCCLVLAVGLSVGLTSQGQPNGGPGTIDGTIPPPPGTSRLDCSYTVPDSKRGGKKNN